GGPSRTLFLWEDGSPMRFYVRPGLAKLRLAPLVLAGGGRLCRVQEPGAVLLAQPGEAAPSGAVSAMRDRYLRHLRPTRAAPVHGERGSGERRDGPGKGDGGTTVLPRPVVHSRVSPLPAEPRGADASGEPAAELGIFAAANREFESTESESDASDISEGFASENREGKSSEETASPLKMGQEDFALPDTQLQGEERPISISPSSTAVGEAVKTIQHLMEKFSMDLFTVTQALLKNNGEVETTFNFLQTGQRLDGYPVWSREDDLELQKDDEHVRNKLIAKFGAENVAKRIAFRKC
ncbi:TE2IP protein, partial [Nothocercus julius]|nr:TE2IP protein [Nothocercus julius]